jgi:hypothetical protein
MHRQSASSGPLTCRRREKVTGGQVKSADVLTYREDVPGFEADLVGRGTCRADRRGDPGTRLRRSSGRMPGAHQSQTSS